MQAEGSCLAARTAGLSRKAELLLAVLIRRGGGIVDEYLLRDGTRLSHGSIVAARRELIAGGWLRLGKKERKLVYILTGQGGNVSPQPPAMPAETAPTDLSPDRSSTVVNPCTETEGEDTGFARLIEPMARVTGRFGSFDEWTDVLIDTLGGNVDITESLVEDGAYQIHSYDHDCDDCYQVTATDDGILVE